MTASPRRAGRLEHRLTTPNASLADLDGAIALVIEHELAALTVNPWLVKAAKRQLGRTRVRLGTVVGYPSGAHVLAVKAFEASKALEQGATQIDFVLNMGALVSRDEDAVYNDMLAVIDMAHSALAEVGVILGPDPIAEQHLRRACLLAERAGADLVVTGTGDATAARSIGRSRIARDSLGVRVDVKACGRFRSAEEIAAAFEAGAARVSTQLSPELLSVATDAPQLAAAAVR